MLARLICFLLDHVLDNLNVLEEVQPYVYVSHGKCARCGIPILDVRDLRDEDES